MIYTGKSMEKCLDVLPGKWKLIAKGHSFKSCDGAVS
jgi:hypothetical protein